jgi:hypothetical protein
MEKKATRVKSAPGKRVTPTYRSIERGAHYQALSSQIQAVEKAYDFIEKERVKKGLPLKLDLLLEIDSEPGFPLSAQEIHALSSKRESIIVLQAVPLSAEEGREQTRVLLSVPHGQLTVLAEKFRKYAEEMTPLGNIPNPWVANISRIAQAALKSLWTDPGPMPVDAGVNWWQFWIRRHPLHCLVDFKKWAKSAGLTLRQEMLKLPDHIVMVGSGTLRQIEGSLDLLNTLAEVRAARPWHYELSDLSGDEQHEWSEAALDRLSPPAANAPAVCVLDTGINRGHPLLQPVLSTTDNHTIFADGDPSDGSRGTGHGTLMAGLAAYADLRELIMESGNGSWEQTHRIEGVKILHPNEQHAPENYGAVTVQAVTTPEIAAPERPRVYVLAITATGDIQGRPSAWSAAVDNCAFGAEEEGEPKRLILVSAGNVDPFALDSDYRYPATNEQSQIEDPAQAWNAVTVGALTHRDDVLETDPESLLLEPISQNGELSALSRTSCDWDAHWPIKPEIVMEGGNAARDLQGSVERRDSLDLLSTSADFRIRPFAPFRGTSPACALAAHLAAKIRASYPLLWPETVRGLLVHSARWSASMLRGLNPYQAFTEQERKQFVRMLRCYGYGEPDAARATYSSQKDVTLLREDKLLPYTGSAGNAGVNDCHVHRLTLPADLLRSLGETTCTMRVTLSYFTAPNPSASNRIPGSRYHYGGALLRFRVRHKDETAEEFMQHVTAEANEEDDESDALESEYADASGQQKPRSLHDKAWALGHKLRGKGGSLIHDVWQGNAADLAAMDRIAVFPVKGWWASRSFPSGTSWHHCHKKPLPYSLIVSVEVSADIPLYTEIQNLLNVPLDAA